VRSRFAAKISIYYFKKLTNKNSSWKNFKITKNFCTYNDTKEAFVIDTQTLREAERDTNRNLVEKLFL
jgi:hypothetical protein